MASGLASVVDSCLLSQLTFSVPVFSLMEVAWLGSLLLFLYRCSDCLSSAALLDQLLLFCSLITSFYLAESMTSK